MEGESRHTCRIEFDRHEARGVRFNLADVARREAYFHHALENASATFILADGAYKEYGVPQARGVGGEIERRAAEVFLVSDDVPQDFTDADDSHGAASSISSASIF
jgi:hypothetical protein